MSGGVKRFGRIEFDATRRRLLVAGRPTPIDRAGAAILACLVEHAGRDVGKDRLLEAGWPGRVVHENSLAKAITRLRQALGEDGAALETVHGHGYRLAADVEEAMPSPAPAGRRRRRAGLVVLALALGLAALGSLGVAAWIDDAPGRAERALRRGEPADAIGRVLWVDDHPGNNAEEKRHLERSRIAVYQVTTTEEALALLAMYEYRAVISDMNRQGRPLAGLELVRAMRRAGDATPFFVYSFVPSQAQQRFVAEAGGQGAAVTPEELYAAILPLFGERRAEAAH